MHNQSSPGSPQGDLLIGHDLNLSRVWLYAGIRNKDLHNRLTGCRRDGASAWGGEQQGGVWISGGLGVVSTLVGLQGWSLRAPVDR